MYIIIVSPQRLVPRTAPICVHHLTERHGKVGGLNIHYNRQLFKVMALNHGGIELEQKTGVANCRWLSVIVKARSLWKKGKLCQARKESHCWRGLTKRRRVNDLAAQYEDQTTGPNSDSKYGLYGSQTRCALRFPGGSFPVPEALGCYSITPYT